MGILPIVFEKSGLNEIKENIVEKKETDTLLKKNSQLFSKTIFSQKVSKDNILDEDIITSKFKPLLNEEKEKDTQKEKKEGIYKKSLLIGELLNIKLTETLSLVWIKRMKIIIYQEMKKITLIKIALMMINKHLYMIVYL